MPDKPESVFPIFHRNDKGETRLDGVGFVVIVGDAQYFVTCAHTFSFDGEEYSFVRINDAEFQIHREIPGIRIGDIENIEPNQIPETEKLICFFPDYLFFPLPSNFQVEKPLEMRSTEEVSMEEGLEIIVFDLDDYSMLSFEAHRDNNLEYLEIRERELQNRFLRRTNFISVRSEPERKGYSGGPLLDANGKCIGFLTSCWPNMGRLFIFKIADLPFAD